RVRRSQIAKGSDSASSRPFLRADEHGDAGLVRKDVRRDDASGQSGVRFRCGSTAWRVPELHAVADAYRRHNRPVDHIGFEIKNLEAFTKKLEAQGIKLDRPYTKVPQLGIAIAFIKDPWGTNIEMTEGLADIK